MFFFFQSEFWVLFLIRTQYEFCLVQLDFRESVMVHQLAMKVKWVGYDCTMEWVGMVKLDNQLGNESNQ